MTKPVAILGSGPAGLLAAHAVRLAGLPTAVFSQPVKSIIGGAQFIHTNIPGITDEKPDAVITYRCEGDEPTYRQKVYGGATVPFTSFPVDGATQDAWSMPAIYDRLWKEFGGNLNEAKVTPEWLDANGSRFQAVISSVPLPALCRSMNGEQSFHTNMPEHSFHWQVIRVVDECKRPSLPDNTVLWSGERDIPWYRTSKLFGIGGAEYGGGRDLPFETMELRKPVRAVCDCFPEVIKVGRFGQFRKGVLSHDGFTGALKGLKEKGLVEL